ncbi:MAG: cytochrome C [Desulfobacterales bacterium]|nr:cytochrome C [Desulfobacterales bacterium]
MRFSVLTLLAVLSLLCSTLYAQEKVFIGSIQCKDCHEEQYDNFTKYSKKANSFSSIKKMEKKLLPGEYQECFQCHTTGFGQNGGFVSESGTPDLKNPGCEVCHGPGSLHAESQDPEDIITEIDIETCISCHNQDRVNEFNFKPLLYSGGH